MKVLVLSNFGMGLYKFRKELLQKMINLGYEVFVSLPSDEFTRMFEDLGCVFIESNVDRRGTNPIADLKLLVSYVKIIKNVRPDIVLTYTVKPNVYGGIACRITKTQYLPNITGLGTAIENESIIQKITLLLYRTGLKKAKCVFFQNESNRKYFIDKGILRTNSIVVPGSGVNLEQYRFEEYPEDDGNTRLLFIGRIMKAKGISELLSAARKIKESDLNIEFHLVGFCEEEHLEQLNELTDAKTIHYHGQQNDVQMYIKNSHATLLPSYHEGTSNVLLESASMGRPILASNVAGCRETFDEGISGFGFEAKNSDALVLAILKFHNLPYEKKKLMGLMGRKKAEKEYDRNVVINAYLDQINK